MIAWILSAGRPPYVAAVLREREAAGRYLAELPAPVRDRGSVASRGDLALPCYLAEDSSGFRPLSALEAKDYAAELARRTPDGVGVYGTMYRLDHEFLPHVPGRDEMGRLPHVDLEARELALVARAGVAALWAHPADGDAPDV